LVSCTFVQPSSFITATIAGRLIESLATMRA
jgi:hypothetical protein